jgi:hypothetical protein
MALSGFIGIIIIIAFFYITFKLIVWWQSVENGLFFPGTLKWVPAAACIIGVSKREPSPEEYGGANNPNGEDNWIVEYYRGKDANGNATSEVGDYDQHFKEIEEAFGNAHGNLKKQRELLYKKDENGQWVLKNEFAAEKYKALRSQYDKNVKSATDNTNDKNRRWLTNEDKLIRERRRDDGSLLDDANGTNGYNAKLGIYNDKMEEAHKSMEETANKEIDRINHTKPEEVDYSKKFGGLYQHEDEEFRKAFIDGHGSIEQQYKVLYDKNGKLKEPYKSDRYAPIRANFYEHYMNKEAEASANKEIRDAVEAYSKSKNFEADEKAYFETEENGGKLGMKDTNKAEYNRYLERIKKK